jgi:hypothetical protein
MVHANNKWETFAKKHATVMFDSNRQSPIPHGRILLKPLSASLRKAREGKP